MPAQCALCLRPLTKPFSISGTEVFHAECAKQVSLARPSVHAKVSIKAAKQAGRIAELEADLAYARREVDMLKRLERENQRLVALDVEAARLRRELAAAGERESEYRRQRDEARRERDAANANVMAAELELRNALAAGRAAMQATERVGGSADGKPADSRDATEIRFSLLDLD